MAMSLLTIILIMNLFFNVNGRFIARIVAGQDAIQHEFPFMALLEINNKPSCGGSLISYRYVLTAAHCVHKKTEENLIVRLGEHDLRNCTESDCVRVNVSKIVIHHGFDYSDSSNDIALLRLEKPVAPTEAIRSICLPPVTYSYEAAGVAIGWGISDIRTHTKADVLQKKIVPLLRYCNKSEIKGPNLENKICSEPFHAHSCGGDSGGPVIFTDRSAVFGIISTGSCGYYLTPNLFTRVSAYNDWIREHTLDYPPRILDANQKCKCV